MSYASAEPNGPPEVLGSTEPRIWTPPLRDLTPDTTYGYDLIEFADAIGTPFDPWQEWLSIHVGELLPDGRPRFRRVLILVARQNGKTTWARALILYWLVIDQVATVLGTSTDRSYAKRLWSDIAKQMRSTPLLAEDLAGVRLTIGEEALLTPWGEYKFAANNGSAGRSMTLWRWLCDEVREHSTMAAYDAAYQAMNAVREAQMVGISNQGDQSAILLDTLREPALAWIGERRGDPRLGLFEWSSPAGAEPDDVHALAWANPNMGRRVDTEALLGQGAAAKATGGQVLTGFRTEVMCQRVGQLDPAVDPEVWRGAGTDEPLDLAPYRRRVALCLDVSLDTSHATLVAAAEVDGVVHIDPVGAWAGADCLRQLRADLPAILATIRPRRIGWFPGGPAAGLLGDFKAVRLPRGTRMEPITAETPSVCMALPVLAAAGDLQHPHDPLLDLHIDNAQRQHQGNRWVFARRGGGPVDGAYAIAGAAHLARTLPRRVRSGQPAEENNEQESEENE